MIFPVFLLVALLPGTLSRAEEHKRPSNHREEIADDHHRRSRQHEPAPTAQSVPKMSYEPQYHYQPFSAVPAHIKQLLFNAYPPQVPYVNPHAFFYPMPGAPLVPQRAEAQFEAEQPAPESSRAVFHTAYLPSRPADAEQNAIPQQTDVIYKKDDSRRHYRSRYNSRGPSDQSKRSPTIGGEARTQNQARDHPRNTEPSAIQQLLQFQAEIPYNVLANEILFQPKKPFVPKPLPDDLVHAQSYPTKVYYIKADGEVLDSPLARVIGAGEMNFKQGLGYGQVHRR